MEIILATALSFGFALFAKSKLEFISGCLPASSMDTCLQSLMVVSPTNELCQ